MSKSSISSEEHLQYSHLGVSYSLLQSLTGWLRLLFIISFAGTSILGICVSLWRHAVQTTESLYHNW